MAHFKKPRNQDTQPKIGPITRYTQAKEYMDKHKVPVMFESLIASLMMERPENHFHFLDGKLEAIKEIGLDNMNWESFVYHLHPLRDPIRNKYVFEKEEEEEKAKEEMAPFADFNEVRENPADALEEIDEDYKPELFLTEPLGDQEQEGDNDSTDKS